jgi:aspartyl-tRNA(Asn)/glutamyl-tRNA(Gln) amidotransferase subunit C
MISKKEVQRVAQLARLSLTEKEIDKYQKELSLVLDYIEKLKKRDFAALNQQNQEKIKNVFRKDELNEEDKADKKDLLSLAPKTKDNYLKVKTIL